MSKLGWSLAGCFVVVLSVWQIAKIHRMEYATGDDFAYYSTYRADPVGLSAVYNALAALPGLEVGRNETNPMLLRDGKNTTLVLAAVSRGPDPVPLVVALEAFVESGGRLVLTFDPEFALEEGEEDCNQRAWQGAVPEESGIEGEDAGNGEIEGEPELEEVVPVVDTEDQWNYRVSCAPMLGDGAKDSALGLGLRVADDSLLPASVPWYSLLHFEGSGPEWRTLYARDTLPVLLERSMGAGTIVLCSDTYPLSNEAQQIERTPGLIAWLAGSSQHILFDEYHLGVSRDPNIMVLLQRYRLHYLLLALLGIALLFLWQSAVPLTPRRSLQELARRDVQSSQRAQAGAMSYLLRRSLPSKELLTTCYAQWRDSAGRRHVQDPGQDEEIRAVVRAANEDGGRPEAIVAAYQVLTQRIQKRS